MKTSTGLLSLIGIMHFINLSNITLFDGKWNGIAMWVNTGLFIVAIAIFLWEELIKIQTLLVKPSIY